MTDAERAAALDTLSDFVSGVDHEQWLTKRAQTKLKTAVTTLLSLKHLPHLRTHEIWLIADAHEQQDRDAEQAEWERLGGAR